ncbi:unnamed protein product, partial [Allacma fusca]
NSTLLINTHPRNSKLNSRSVEVFFFYEGEIIGRTEFKGVFGNPS